MVRGAREEGERDGWTNECLDSLISMQHGGASSRV